MIREDASLCVSPRAVRWLWISAVVGISALVAGGVLQPQRLWPNLLLFGSISVGFGLGGLLLMAFRDLTGARWNESFSCVREAMAATLPWTAPILAVIVIIGLSFYPWSQTGAIAAETDWFKRWWLEPKFFTIRAIAYLLIWVAFAKAMIRATRDKARQGGPTRASVRLSAVFVVVFALTFWLASTDWIMSLEPTWYSTMFGVYNFGGILLSSQALVVLLTVWLRQRGPLRNVVTTSQLRDLGTLLLSYSCLWMYFWFCQYMLIWYTNIPEETSHFESRLHGLWAPVFCANIVINWGIPFPVLLPRASKESTGVLVKVALLVLGGRWLDVYMLILPSTVESAPTIGFCEIGAVCLAVGTLGLLLVQALQKSPPSCTRRMPTEIVEVISRPLKKSLSDDVSRHLSNRRMTL